MTIFNKFSNIAHKAKEHALSKSILSKDKRLDHSLSSIIRTDMIHFVQMTNVGLESKISAMAFDTVAGLLAIAGGSNGTGMNQLRIFGKGVSSILPLPNIDTIKYIQFKTGCPLLILIDKKNIIYTIDLKRQQILHMLPTQGIITSYCYCTGTDWMFIGFADGCIDVFDTRLGQMAKYGIPDLVASQQQQQQQQEQQQERRHESGNIVVALEMHPNNINWLLIGYESTVFLWDIRENMIHSTYELKNSDVRLSSLVWNPQGDHFMAGYDDGYLHLWAINSEHRPVLSRQVFPSLDKSQPCEPVYKLAWYFDDNAQKSYLVVCGGSAIKDIHGLHVLEFSLNHLSDVRKQSIIPSDMELMDFSLLWSEPYQPRNPLGIMLLGCNGAISAHGLDHGYPTLTLPPSLSMVHPFVSNACFIPMVDEQLYRKMTTLTDADLQTRYLPLTGGVVGPGHIYKIPSNDILLTMHAGEIIQFWDASYTSLRPLSQLVIRCHDDLDDPTVYVCCIDLNAVSGTLCVGFNDGTILTYEIVDNLPSKNQDQEEYSKMENTNAQFISQCDETINELAEILGDMQRSTPTMDESREEQQTEIIRNTNNNDGNSDTDAALSNATNINCDNDTLQQESSACNDSTNPFVSVQGVAQEPAQVTSQNAYEPESDMISNHSDNIGNKVDDQDIRDLEVQIVALKRSTKDFGYSPDVKIKLDGAIHSIVSAGTDIIACLTALGQIFIINTTIQKLYHTIDIKDLVIHETQKDAVQDEDPTHPVDSPSISCIKFINTHTTMDIAQISTQLFIGLDNGNLYQCDVLSSSYVSPVLLHRNDKREAAIQDIHVIDLKGKSQGAEKCIISTGTIPEPSKYNMEENVPTTRENKIYDSGQNNGLEPSTQEQQQQGKTKSPPSSPQSPMERSKSFLRRKSVKRSAKSTTTRPSSNVSIDSQEEAWEALSRTSTTTTTSSTGSNNSKYSSGRRYLPSFDYQYHENPHFVTVTKPQSICVILSGTGIKLFECRLQDLEDGKLQKDTIISTTPIEIDGLACLSILLQSKQLVILSLPHLQPIAKTSLPENVCRLNEAMFTTEGRVLFWTGQYEMQEWMYLHSETSLPIGHSVDLFDDQKSMPPHPMETIQRPNKKTWFGAVAGAFKKGPLSIGELDTLMGRIHPGFDQNNQSKQQSPSRSGSSSTGIRKTGMFKELGDKVNERGERLDELGKKFSDMNDASGDFLKAVKDYNERQAQKKWWEF